MLNSWGLYYKTLLHREGLYYTIKSPSYTFKNITQTFFSEMKRFIVWACNSITCCNTRINIINDNTKHLDHPSGTRVFCIHSFGPFLFRLLDISPWCLLILFVYHKKWNIAEKPFQAQNSKKCKFYLPKTLYHIKQFNFKSFEVRHKIQRP